MDAIDTNGTTPVILGVSFVAAIVNGLLAGGDVDRAIVARPAWNRLGLVAWADHSRHADLGTGQVFYPAMAIGGTLLAVVAATLLLRASSPLIREDKRNVIRRLYQVVSL